MRRVCLVTTALGSLLFFHPALARAEEESIIRSPGNHPEYRIELEPHGILGFGGPFDRVGTLGPGVRATFIIVQNGFVKTINNSVGIGVGADLFIGRSTGLVIPAVMQWNFFLSEHWSVMGEPGLGIASGTRNTVIPVFYGGGRYHFSDKIALTMRIGYPSLSVGASFFF